MFVAGTKIFTDDGWKNIEDISGNDKVLVRNFIGDAEFIQPFALKKRSYTGVVYKIGANRWSFCVTPEHLIVYDKDDQARGINFKSEPAEKFKIKADIRIHRKFKYMFAEEPKKEYISIYDDFGKRTVTVPHEDWYKLVGYVLRYGFIRKGSGKPMLQLLLDKETAEDDVFIVGDILDRIGIPWHYQKNNHRLVASSKNTLCNRLITRLGATKRREMFLSPKIIYNSTKELSGVLLDMIPNPLVTSNPKLVESLELFGTLNGYNVTHKIIAKANEVRGLRVRKNDSFLVTMVPSTKLYTPSYIKKSKYDGNVYGIELFQGQVYVKEGSAPVWVNPK